MAIDSNTKTEATKVMGDVKSRVFDVTIGTYDDDTNGDGESYAPVDAGFRRFYMTPRVEVVDGSGYVAQYDESTGDGVIRLFEAGADAAPLDEVASSTAVNVDLKVHCLGV